MTYDTMDIREIRDGFNSAFFAEIFGVALMHS